MIDVLPFRGLRYEVARVGDLSPIISPPYDLVAAEEEELYYHRSPYNVIRLEQGLVRAGNSPSDERYSRAADTLHKWLSEGILVRNGSPAFYLSSHEFEHLGRIRKRWGLTAKVRLEDWETGRIRPHELTMKEPTADRLQLLRSCQANISPIMGLFRDESGEFLSLVLQLAASEPDCRVTDDWGVTHSLWLIRNQSHVTKISSIFSEKVLYIADGHHRYQTALNYRAERRRQPPSGSGDEPYNFVMMTLSDSEDPGLIMLSTHRLVRGLEPQKLEQLEQCLYPLFHLEELPPSSSSLAETLEAWLRELEARGRDNNAFGIYGLRNDRLILATARNSSKLIQMMPTGNSLVWKKLDVNVLHLIILSEILGVDSAHKARDCLDFTRDGLECISAVNSGEYQLAFFLNPAPISSILEIADAGERMPQKSTFFYPKMPTGLVIHPLWE